LVEKARDGFSYISVIIIILFSVMPFWVFGWLLTLDDILPVRSFILEGLGCYFPD